MVTTGQTKDEVGQTRRQTKTKMIRRGRQTLQLSSADSVNRGLVLYKQIINRFSVA